MGYTITEKILLTHAIGVKEIEPGAFIKAKVDLCLGNDITLFPLGVRGLEACYDTRLRSTSSPLMF